MNPDPLSLTAIQNAKVDHHTGGLDGRALAVSVIYWYVTNCPET